MSPSKAALPPFEASGDAGFQRQQDSFSRVVDALGPQVPSPPRKTSLGQLTEQYQGEEHARSSLPVPLPPPLGLGKKSRTMTTFARVDTGSDTGNNEVEKEGGSIDFTPARRPNSIEMQRRPSPLLVPPPTSAVRLSQVSASSATSTTPSVQFPALPPPRVARTASTSAATSSSSSSSCPPSTSTVPTSMAPLPPPPDAAEEDSRKGLDPTADLIRQLYTRLDTVGVPGDGWEEGVERSRDGIINRLGEGDLEHEGSRESAVDSGSRSEETQGRQASTSPTKEDQILKRVDRFVVLCSPLSFDMTLTIFVFTVHRYGFFSGSHPAALACQHNRLAILPSTPYLLLPSPSSPSPFLSFFSHSNNPPPSLLSPPTSPLSPRPHLARQTSTGSLFSSATPLQLSTELRRTRKWHEMLRVKQTDGGGNVVEWDVEDKWWRGKRFQKRVFKGVPDRWRRAVWGVEMERTAREGKGKGKERVPSLEELEEEYQVR